ncbi:hypothetical protein [Treponema peruense]|uniref:Uncharacterized protein n=1 Tax=Treponema peruense TaxID=2787628 RepID=A0A7T3REK3_9SPIR|nr:hypothetical protein [Treponema peruense]QQA01717.1 hypothetical protein IWA51_03640 [Treponema peruense]
MTDNEYLKGLQEKREHVIKFLEPKMKAFGIDDWDYIVKDNLQRETLRIGNIFIATSMNSDSAIEKELIGYLFVAVWLHGRSLPFKTQTTNRICQYWIDEKRCIENGFIEKPKITYEDSGARE